MKPKTDAEQIKKYRKMAGLTQSELGLRVGLSKPTIAGYEIGSRVKPALLKKILVACRAQIRRNAREAGIIS